MKKIHIFLASSIIEFANERMAIENFIRNISDNFEEKYNIKVQPLLCENFDDAVAMTRKQEEYNEKIRESELCFFIFFTKVGEYTREEFDVARAAFEKNGKPKIYTYFKELPEGQAEQGVCDFMNELEKSIGHYYGMFSHIDTVKLRILLSLKLQEMDFLEIKTEGGNCIVDGSAVMPIGEVSEFANNKLLTQLLNELAEVEKEYFELKPQYEKADGDNDFYRRYSAVATKRQRLIEETDELRQNIFNVSLRLVQDDVRGEISERQKRAYALFEKGDFEGCMSVLDAADIDDEFLRNRRKAKEFELSVCRKYIKENKTAIDILTLMKKYANRLSEIEERYEKIIPVIIEMKTELSFATDYVEYLINQNKFDRAYEVAETVLPLYEKGGEDPELIMALAIICENRNQLEKAEELHLRSIEIRESISEKNEKKYSDELALSYNNAGNFYYRKRNMEKAKDYYLRAISIYEKLVREGEGNLASGLSLLYNNLGHFFAEGNNAEEAERYFLRAIGIQEKVAEVTGENYNSHIATVCGSLGSFYEAHNNAQQAEKYYLRSIEAFEKLASENPERYNPELGTIYGKAGGFYDKQNRAEKAEKYYLRSTAILEKLAEENSARYNEKLVVIYNDLAGFYHGKGKIEPAERYYLKALSMQEELATEKSGTDDARLASIYNNLGLLFLQQGKEKGESFLLRAIGIREELAKRDSERYSPDLAQSYNNAGAFYHSKGMAEKADEYFIRSIEIREDLAKKNPSRYIPDLAVTYYRYAYFKKSASLLESAVGLARMMPDHPVCRQIIINTSQK